jgi:hypothetical protein
VLDAEFGNARPQLVHDDRPVAGGVVVLEAHDSCDAFLQGLTEPVDRVGGLVADMDAVEAFAFGLATRPIQVPVRLGVAE